ncbi:MAG TPA: 2-oxoacid:acceptor oxidoreductase family protein [Sedimentisphaerales bacterium]|nr:2-oxoacid:acceptor oxidoreductase family protein [Sedimentisphaerales bacterium]
MDRKGNDKSFPAGAIEGVRMTGDNFYEEIIIAGFGGQGIMLTGKLLAQTAMKAGKEVTYMPSYGAEVRGGTANCMVVIAEKKIACPAVAKPDSLIVLNKASLNKFGPRLKNGGLLIMNSSLIDTEPQLDDSIEIIAVPADELAVELGSQKSANMVALGAYLQKRGQLTADGAAQALPDVLARRYHKTLPVNTEALRRGAEFVKACCRA